MCQYCAIIPTDVLERLGEDKSLSSGTREAMKNTALVDQHVRKLREQARRLTRQTQAVAPATLTALATAPLTTVYDCKHLTTLPGTPVPNPGASKDATAKRTFDTTSALARFYAQVFGRNSIDNAGMTLMSSIHYGVAYQNAFWNGAQMTYGDGDASIFVDFTLGTDVIGHELTHGVTQNTLQLVYSNEPGGLNESLSDVFGSMFRQWLREQTVTSADWLIGADIIGPAAKQRGYTCLRDMADPAARHCLGRQPAPKYANYTPGMDPHYSSSIPNFAFYSAAMAIGGRSWEKAGQIWYWALTKPGPKPNLTMRAFADLTRKAAATLYPSDTKVKNTVDAGWKAVGL